MTFRSKSENAAVDAAGFAPLQDGWEYTAIPVLDASEVLSDGKTPICFQGTMKAGLAALASLGLVPLTPDDVEFLHAEAVAGRCIELPAFVGTPIAESDLKNRRISDEANRANAKAMGWKPGMRLCNFGKGIVDGPGRPADGMWLMGWRVDRLERYSPAKGQPGHRSGPGFIQPRPTPGRAPHGLDAQADDGTNLWGKRRVTVDPTGDTDPAPGSADWTGAVTGALRAALEPSAAAIRAAIDRGGHVLPPPPSHSPGGHVLPTPKATMRQTIRLGSKGADVTAWQTIIGAKADGAFGPGTEAATRAWQNAHGLAPDGIVGPRAWTAAGETPAPIVAVAGDQRAPACLAALRDANAAYPRRSRRSDGIMGDARHQASKSSHNLGNAVDITHDPANGCDCNALALAAMGDPRIQYIIWNKRIWNVDRAAEGWRKYTGTNGHTHHMHLDIKPGLRGDASPWPWQ